MSGGRKAGLFDDRALDWVALSQTNVTSECHHVQQVTIVNVSTRLSYATRLNSLFAVNFIHRADLNPYLY
jgi:hypothetical protein